MRIVHESDRARLSVLTPHLVRFEWSPGGQGFTDSPTQVVLDRDLGPVELRVTPTGDGVEVVTDGFELVYDGGPPTPSGLSLQVRGGVTNYHSVWRYGVPVRPGRRLGGTARTLDEVDGRTDLESGVAAEGRRPGHLMRDGGRRRAALSNFLSPARHAVRTGRLAAAEPPGDQPGGRGTHMQSGANRRLMAA